MNEEENTVQGDTGETIPHGDAGGGDSFAPISGGSEPHGASQSGDEQHKALAVVGYIIPILFFIPLLTEAKSNEFARFHANQQLNLLLFWVIGNFVSGLLMIVLIGALLFLVVSVVGIVFVIMGVVNAINLEKKPLPIIGKFDLIK